MTDKDITFEVLTTDTHTCVLTPGGLLLGETDRLDLEEEEGLSVPLIANHHDVLTITPEEALKIASFVEQHKGYLEARQQMIVAYFTIVAQALLDEFTNEAQELYIRGEHGWPEISYRAQNTLIMLGNKETNPMITAWYAQARRDQYFPRAQQQELLFRYFRKLYYEKFPLPPEEEEEDEGEEE